MRMNDYEYEFVQDSIEKKGTARSARNARTHCGKAGAVRLPSDFLTKKEIKAMSGEVIQYASLKKPMTLEEFKKLPNDLKVMYIKWIREKFNAPDKCIAEMLGVKKNTFSAYMVDLKLNKGPGNAKKIWEQEKFYAWVNGVDENAVEGTADVEPEVEVEQFSVVEDTSAEEQFDTSTATTCGDTVPAPYVPYNPYRYAYDDGTSVLANPTVIPVIPKSGTMSFEHNRVDDILQTVKALLDGAGVKINCTISWEVVETSDGVCK